MNTLRKISLSVLALVMVFAMAGVTKVHAAASEGSLIKSVNSPAVYYLKGGKRIVFPNYKTYATWYSDFSGVMVIPQAELESYPLGGNVTYRMGTKLVKIDSMPAVYAVGANHTLHKIVSEADAINLYGPNWAKMVDDVPDAFFTNYATGADKAVGMYGEGQLLMLAGSPDVYMYTGTEYRKVASEAAFNANRFNFNFVVKAPSTWTTLTPRGTDITGAEAGLLDTGAGAGGAVSTGSGLTVALASDTPASSNVPSQATGVKMAKFNFTASNDGDVILSNLTVKRMGVGNPAEISKLYLYDGNTRLTSGRTLGTSNNEASFSNIGLTIAKGSTKTLTVVADVANNATAGSHAISIQSASMVTASGATVTGSFPMMGNTMSFSTVDVGLIDVESNNTTYTRKVGETGVEVANFSVNVNSTEDAMFNGIALYNNGDDVISNLKLYRGSDMIATATKNGRTFTFALATPIEILRGNSANFTVKGDVAGRDGDAAEFFVRYNTDVMTTGKTYGYGMGVDATVGTANSYIEEVDASVMKNTVNVDAGQLTVAFNGPVTGDVSKNTTDVVLMNFSVTPQSAVEVSKMTVAISGNGSLASSDIDNLEVKINGVTVGTKNTVTVGNNVFTDTFTLPAGQVSSGQIIVDINNTAGGDETIKATLKDMTSTSNWTIKTMDGDTVTDIVPSGDIAGNTMTVTSASLAVNRASSPANGSSFVKGASNVPVAGFAFTAGTSVDTKVTSIKVTAYAADDGTIDAAGEKNQASGAANVMVAVGLYDEQGTLIAPKKSLTVGGSDITATFDTLNWVIPKGTTKSLVAKADISSTAPMSGTNDSIALTIAAAGDVVAEYSNGTSLTPTLATNNNTPTIAQTITTGGTITLALAGDSAQASLVTAGTQNVSYAKAKFTTVREAYLVRKLRITNSANDSNFVSVGIEYKKQDGTTATATAPLVAGAANFTFAAGSEIYLTKDADTTITVKGNMNTTIGGAANGQASTLTVESDAGFEAYGVESGEQKTTTLGADAVSRTMTVYETKPSFAVAESNVLKNLIPSASTKLMDITITADAGKDVTFVNGLTNALTVNISSACGTATADELFVLKDQDGVTLATPAAVDICAATSVTFAFEDNSLTVPAGTSKTVSVYGDTSELTTAGNTVQLWLDDAAGANVDWSINGAGSYNHADILFRGDLYGPSWLRQS